MAEHVAVTPNRWIPSPQVRRYLYRVLIALGPVALAYGLLTDAEIVVWLGLAETILASPVGALALANVPTETAEVAAPVVERDNITGL